MINLSADKVVFQKSAKDWEFTTKFQKHLKWSRMLDFALKKTIFAGVPNKNNVMIPKVLRRMHTDDSDSTCTNSSNKENESSEKAAQVNQNC